MTDALIPWGGMEGERELRAAAGHIAVCLQAVHVEMRAMTIETEAAGASAGRLTVQSMALAGQLAAAQGELQGVARDAAELDNGLQDAGQSSERLWKGINTESLEKGLKKLTGIAKNIGKQTLTLGTGFETAMAKAATLFGGVQVDMAGLDEKMLALSNSTGLAAAELGQGLYSALAAGVPATEDMGEAMHFMEAAARLAKVGFTDVDTAVASTAQILNAYKLDVGETDRIHRILMQTQAKGNTTVKELGGSIAQVTPTAAAMNVAFEQVGAALASMTAQGTPTAQATTQLNSLFAELGKQGTAAQKGLDEATQGTQYAGQSFQDMMAAGVPLSEVLELLRTGAQQGGQSLETLFSSAEAGKAALALSGENARQFTDDLAAMGSEADVVGEAYEKVSGTIGATIDKMKNTVKNKLVEVFNDASGGVGDTLAQLGERLENMLSGIDTEALAQRISVVANAAMDFGGFLLDHGAVIAAMLTTIGTAVAGWKVSKKVFDAAKAFQTFRQGMQTSQGVFRALDGALKANSIGLIITAVAALVAGFITLWENCEGFRNFFISAWEGIQQVVSAVAGAVVTFFTETIPGAWDSVVEFFSGIPEWLGGLWESVKQACSDGWQAVAGFFTETIPEWLGGLWESVKQACSDGWQAVVGFFRETIPEWLNALKEWFQQIPYNLGSALGEAVKKLAEWGTDAVNWVTETLPQIIQNVGEWFAQLPGRIWEALAGAYTRMVEWGINTLQQMGAAASGAVSAAVEWFQGLPGRIWEALTGAYTRMVEWGANTLQQMGAAASGAVSAAVEWFQGLPGRIGEELSAAWQRMKEWAANLITTARTEIPQFVEQAYQAFLDLPKKVVDVGKNVVKGIWDGITSMVRWVKDKITGWCGSFVQGFKDALGIHSPSRVMAAVGRDINAGMAQGIEESRGMVVRSAKRVSALLVQEEERIQGQLDRMEREAVAKREQESEEQYLAALNAKYDELAKAERKEKQKILDDIAKLQADREKTLNQQSEEALKTSLQNQLTVVQNYKKEYENAVQDVENAQGDMERKLQEFGALFERTQADAGDQLELRDLEEDIRQIEAYGQALEDLKGKGIPAGLLDEIQNMSVAEGLQYARTLNGMTDEQYAQYIDTWQRKQEAAATVAREFYSGELENLKTEFADKLPDELSGIKEDMQDLGVQSGQGLADGFWSQQEYITSTFVGVMENALAAAKEAMQIHSPSKRWAQVGRFMASGLGVGFTDRMRQVARDITASIPVPSVPGPVAAVESGVNGIVSGLAPLLAAGGDVPPIHVHVELSGREIAKAVYDPLKAERRRRGER